jgi:hypothetical protein
MHGCGLSYFLETGNARFAFGRGAGAEPLTVVAVEAPAEPEEEPEPSIAEDEPLAEED